MRKKYLNGHRRELILWLGCVEQIIEAHRGYLTGKELTWANSTLLSAGVTIQEMMRGADDTELRAVFNAAKRVKPILFAEDRRPEDAKVRHVDVDTLYDLAESAVELCKYDCRENFADCKRRAMFLELLLEPWSEDGPCQYYRGKVEEGGGSRATEHKISGTH